jgi:DNA replication and repair protein RecF
VQVRQLSIKNFRCFTDFEIQLDNRLVLITGTNGSGKTSILEALHYACYLRSFRTYLPKELLHFEHDTFFIKIQFSDNQSEVPFDHELQVGFSGKKKLVKLDQKTVNSYKELNQFYRVITLTEDDLVLIKGDPESRRHFLDQALSLIDPEYLSMMRNYKDILVNRNALLYTKSTDNDSYEIWTKQLWNQAKKIQEKRQMLLEVLEKKVNQILQDSFSKELVTSLQYKPRVKGYETYEFFKESQHNLQAQEMAFGRSLFGAHLDDITINFAGKRSKHFASRGQQKLTVILLKIALLHALQEKQGAAVLLLDDFMTDFDTYHAEILMEILTKLPGQLIFTSPVAAGPIEDLLKKRGAQCYQIGSTRL